MPAQRPFFEFKNTTSAESAELYIFDEIGFWGTTANSFREQLKAVTAKKVTLHMNSPGGEVMAGIAIYHLIKNHAAKFTGKVDGIAASIGSLIMMACDTVEMPSNTFMFLHSPLVQYASGDADNLRILADELDKVEKGLIASYMAKTGKDEKTVKGWLDGDTLFTAEDALAAGLADKVTDRVEMAAKFDAKAHFAEFPALIKFTEAQAKVVPVTSPKNNTMTPEEIAEMNGLKESAKNHKTATDKAVTDALALAKTAEAKRRKDIQAFAAKYNKDGDLDASVLAAISDDAVTVETFKDTVLDIVNARPTKAAIKPGKEKTGTDAEAIDLDDDAVPFAKRYAATTAGSPERRKLVRANPSEAKRLARGQD